MRFWKLKRKKMMKKPLKLVVGRRGEGMKNFLMDYFNSLSVFELESLCLESGSRFTIEDGKITDVEIEAAPTI